MKHTLAVTWGLLRIGFAESVAYRTELFLWVLSSTMPLVMMALFSAVASSPDFQGSQGIGRYGAAHIVTYFLVTLVVRQVTSSWAAWQLGRDIRQGVLSLRLLKPVHPLLSYGIESLTAIPLRLMAMSPVLVVCVLVIDPKTMSAKPMMCWLALLAVTQAWLLSVALSLFVGCLSFFLESGVKLMDFVQVAFFLASGYLIPVDLFPPWARAIVDVLPFRYQLALPVEILTGAYDATPSLAVTMCLRQALYAAAFFAALSLTWRRGVLRFEAFGG